MDRNALIQEARRSRLAADALRRAAEFESLAGFDALALARADAATAELARAVRLERQASQSQAA
jgi:hypothetical protein